ncbi:MAG: hypothetical protein LUC90_02765 [Lachnospiraceae bacterium]|nr:hypothetical protein [Lachnospiraceae bacterium]
MKVRKLFILLVALSLSVTSCGKYTDVTANDHENISVSESEQPEDEAADEEETVMDYANMTKEELERIFDIYGTCVQYHTDPQELADYLRESSTSEVFSPFSSVSIYEEDEWKERMAAYYGEDWEVSTPQEASDKNSPGR